MSYLGNKTHLEQRHVANSYLYFRTVVDVDNDDGNASNLTDSIMIPSDSVSAMYPNSDTQLVVTYEPIEQVPQAIILTIATNTHKKVMIAISRACLRSGVHVVADDVVTNLANATVSSTYLIPEITACVSIQLTDGLTP